MFKDNIKDYCPLIRLDTDFEEKKLTKFLKSGKWNIVTVSSYLKL